MADNIEVQFNDIEDALKYINENGIVDTARIQNILSTVAKRQDLLKQHENKIWLGKDGCWCTYIPLKQGGRKFIKKHTRKDVEDAVINFYEEEDKHQNSPTFLEVYHEWRLYHDPLVGPNSQEKADVDMKKFFTDKSFVEKRVQSFTEDDVNLFLCTTIKNLQLCKSAAKRMYQDVNRTFEFAERHGYVEKSPTTYLKAKDFYKYCADSERSKREKCISKADFKKISERLQEDHIEKPEYIPSYAVEFASMTGMRVGEVAALSWDCIYDDYILINKSQKYNSKTREYYIDKTKNGKERIFPLTPEIKELLQRVYAVEEEYGYLTKWVFSDADGHIHFRKICSCLKSKCRQLGIETKGIHAYRKTLNSNMRHNGVSSVVAASLLGHSPEVNEKYYTFDVADISEKASIISQANALMDSVR